MRTRITTRVIIYQDNKILFSRGEGTDFWYPGDGGWKDDEDLRGCCIREVKEETGLDVGIIDLMYVQEFYAKNKNQRTLELFFLAKPMDDSTNHQFHQDQDNDNRLLVEENRWFSHGEIEQIKDKVFPEFVRDQFWEDIKKFDYTKQTYSKSIEK